MITREQGAQQASSGFSNDLFLLGPPPEHDPPIETLDT